MAPQLGYSPLSQAALCAFGRQDRDRIGATDLTRNLQENANNFGIVDANQYPTRE
jgi:hypothetical protein